MHITLPEKVKYIIHTIQAAGYEAYAVGGCVRDSILGRMPDDWDITTSATPFQIKGLFRRTIDTGIQHGTVTVMLEKEGFEVTTYRIDGEYEDSRHPKEVIFTANLTEDLKRRDFTVNAMAYNEQAGLIDLFHGMEDIKQGIIRCVGQPEERFGEDALRMMRAIRFSAQLGYTIEEETLKAIAELAPALSNISKERIQVELVKLLVSPHPEYWKIAYDTGVTNIILPEWNDCMTTLQHNPHHCFSVGEHILRSMQEIRPHKVLRLAMLFHDIGKPEKKTTDEQGIDHFYKHALRSEEIARQVLKRLKFDNDTINKVCKLVLYHDYGNGVEPTATIVRRAMHTIGEDSFPDLFAVKRADILAQSDYRQQEKLSRISRFEAVYQDILKAQDCVSLKTLAVTGKDLIAMGMQPGKEIGDTLNQMLEIVLDNPECNTKEYLLSTM